MNILNNIDIPTFLKEYWQKKPLLIRNAFQSFISPIDPDDLAGLAMEEDAESRLIFESGPNGPWELKHGPFTEEDFNKLPDEKWTLLVQAVDQWVPELADIVDQFKFIPKWRLDDLMVSFAPKGGSVGPHFDQYDVFLLQAHGQRHWQIGPKYSEDSQFIKSTDLKILSNMDICEEWTLNPGDMLYLPPQYAHHGVALNDCLTFSIGFRAPSETDILTNLTDYICAELNEDERYSDPDQKDARNTPAEIDHQAIDRLQAILLKHINNKTTLSNWLASYMTQSKYEELQEPLEDQLEWDELIPFIEQAHLLTQNETSRWAYYETEETFKLTINGQLIGAAQPIACHDMAKHLANNRHIQATDIMQWLGDKQCQQLLLELFNLNHLYFDEE